MKFLEKIVLGLAVLFLASSLTAQKTKKTKEDYQRDLKSEDIQLQEEACRYLGKEKDVSSVNELIFLLEDKKVDLHVRVAAANALAIIGKEEKNDSIYDSLLQTVQKSSVPPSLRYTSLLALISLGEKEERLKASIPKLKSSSDLYLKDFAEKMSIKYNTASQKK